MTLLYSTIILIVIALVLFYYYNNIRPLSSTKIRDLYLEGLDLLISGHRKKAYKYFKEIIDQDTTNIKSYIKMGQIVRESKNPKQALKIHTSISLRQDLSKYERVELHKNISLDYYDLKDMVHAIDECLYILKIDKKNEWSMLQLIKYFIECENWEDASKYLNKYNKIKNINDNHRLGLFKIQQARQLVKKKQFQEARNLYEKAIELSERLSISYYYIGNSYSVESDIFYKKANQDNSDINSNDYKTNMESARRLLGKSIPMWVRYANLEPQQSWLVIHLLKDALFVLDRFDEFELILKDILQEAPDNLEVLAALADIHDQRGETSEALELLDSSKNKNEDSLLVKLIRVKLQARKESDNSEHIIKELDSIIHDLVTDEQFQKNRRKYLDKDLLWLYENTRKNLIE